MQNKQFIQEVATEELQVMDNNGGCGSRQSGMCCCCGGRNNDYNGGGGSRPGGDIGIPDSYRRRR